MIGLIKHSQSALSLQYLKKEVRDGFFFACRKTSKFLQVGFIGFDESGQLCPKSDYRKLLIFLQYLRKKMLMKLIFCMQINIKVSYKLILTSWVCLARQNFTSAIKYFSVATAFVFYYDAKHLDILRRSSPVVTCFTHFFVVSFVDFEQVNVCMNFVYFSFTCF